MIRRHLSSTVFGVVLACSAAACSGQKARSGEGDPGTGGKPQGTAKNPLPGGLEGATANTRSADIDNDGRPEVTKYYKTGPDGKPQLAREDIDLTWDGRTDIWRYFDANGLVEKEEWDTDYDGKVDEIRYFEEGVIVRSERDRNNDGRFDIVRYYKGGKLERKESDTNDDGKTDRWEYYSGNVLDRVGVDKDRDGSVDTWAKQPGSGGTTPSTGG